MLRGIDRARGLTFKAIELNAALPRGLTTVEATQAFNAAGLFGNQHTVCRPGTPKWRPTVERLKAGFAGWDRE